VTSRAFVDFARSGPYFAGLLLLALIAFWPSYLSQLGAQSAYTHLHALLAAVWMLMLIAQPILIRRGRRDYHRALGRTSYGLVPLILVSMTLLAHSRIARITGDAFALQTYVLYLQVSLIIVFGLCYALAIVTRRDMPLHARFMICTGFTLIDPVVIRLMFWIDSSPSWNYQWFTFGLTDLAILTLIWLERDARRGRWVFPAMLVVFVASQLPALLPWTNTPAWQAFARWFAALPLT
jgi:FtsH-binding integral membrane protein